MYDISGRCGVYAKTDIQPLLNQEQRRKIWHFLHFMRLQQTIGVDWHRDLKSRVRLRLKVVPLTFNPVLVRVFSERLQLEKEDILIPEHPELMIATGAVLSLKEMLRRSKKVAVADILKKLEQIQQGEEAETVQIFLFRK